MPDGPKLALYLRFWAWVYRRTQYTHSSIYEYKYIDLRSNLDRILEKCQNSHGDIRFSISLHCGIQDYYLGLHVGYKHAILPSDDFFDRIIKRTRRLFNI